MRRLNVRLIGWILAIFGIASVAALLTLSAWLSRNNNSAFNTQVGWANIASMTVSALGVILIMTEKVGAFSSPSDERISQITDNIAREAIRQDVRLLAHLLSTDELDSRAASGNFRVHRLRGRARGRAGQSARSIRAFGGIVGFYLKETSGRMVILGAPGTGKTVLAASLTVGLLERHLGALADKSTPIAVPCLFNLPSWDPESDDLADWLETQIIERFRVSRKIASTLINHGRILPVLDGLDEMDAQDAEKKRSNGAVSRINDYIALTPGCRIVVICRSGPRYYEQLVRRISNADEIEVERLKPHQIIEYIKGHCANEAAIVSWQPVIDVLETRRSRLVLSTLNTPWRMSAAIMFSLLGGDPANLLPTPSEVAGSKAHSEYAKRVELLLMEAFVNSRVAVYRRGGPSAAKRIAQLRVIANMLIQKRSSTREGSQILLHQWWQVVGGHKIRAAQVTVAWLTLHIPLFILANFFINYVTIRTKFSFVVLCLNYGTILIFSLRYATTRKGPITFNWGTARSARGRWAMVVGFALAATVGVSEGIVDGAFYGIAFGVTSIALSVLVLASVGPDPANATRPLATLIDDRNFSVLVGIVIGAYATLYYVTLLGLAVALTFASMCVIGSLFASYYARYFVAVAYGGLREGLPWRFAQFLDWCHAAGLLRISGPGYQFRHQELLDYLGNG